MSGMGVDARHEGVSHTVAGAGQRATDGDGGASSVDGLWLTNVSAVNCETYIQEGLDSYISCASGIKCTYPESTYRK